MQDRELEERKIFVYTVERDRKAKHSLFVYLPVTEHIRTPTVTAFLGANKLMPVSLRQQINCLCLMNPLRCA